jgi:hypothetical protein
VADFRGGRLTSDGGWCWVAEADAVLGLSAALAAVMPEYRRRRGRHAVLDLVRQRLYQLVAGYEDQDDADTLRRDPLLKLVCGRLPESDPDLASQPTFSRFENAFSARDCYRLAEALGELYLRERERDGLPAHIVLDLDSTDDPTHGEQEGSAYHGYFRQAMYHPLLVFDGTTGQFITAILRPGNAHAGAGALAILKRVVARLRSRWPEVTIELRADAGFAKPEIYAFCEQAGLAYTIGLVTNPRLERLAAPLLADALAQQAAAEGAKVRLVAEDVYQADSWPAPRRVVIKAEALAKGPNTRFVVTSRDDPPEALYAWYTARGNRELDQGSERRLLCRPPLLPSLPGQPAPAPAPWRRLLAAGHVAPLAGGRRRGAATAGDGAPAPHQDRGTRPRIGHPRPSALGLQSPRRAPLAPSRYPRGPFMNNPG